MHWHPPLPPPPHLIDKEDNYKLPVSDGPVRLV